MLLTQPIPNGTILFDRFCVLSQIGKGNHATVYHARDLTFPRGERDVALKVSSSPLLRNEARRLTSVHHPRIPAFVDFIEAKPSSALVMEFIAGCSLQEYLFGATSAGNRPGLNALSVIEIGLVLCDALHYLHTRRVHRRAAPLIHCDIKPSNILADSSCGIHLIDLSVARPPTNPGSPPQVSLAELEGTCGYIAPEYYRGQISPRVDIYSLGATLYTLSTGEEPWRDGRASFKPLWSPLGLLIRNMVATNPILRPASARRVGMALAVLRSLYLLFWGKNEPISPLEVD